MLHIDACLYMPLFNNSRMSRLLTTLLLYRCGYVVGRYISLESEIMELVPSIGKASVENSLKKLIEDSTIQRHGKGKSTFYTRTDN
jgi:hypothetical protein